MDIPKVIVFNGVKYYRVGRGEYYLGRVRGLDGRKHPKGLHVAIWESHHQLLVPKGWEVHHKDFDPHNNDPGNLQCLSHDDHRALPHPGVKDKAKILRQLAKERLKTTAWHRSPEGRALHKRQAKQFWDENTGRDYTCETCGKHFQSRQQRGVRYCSPYCGYRGRVARGKYTVIRRCAFCKQSFSAIKPINPSRIRSTCNRSCRAKIIWQVRRLRSSI